MKRLTGEYVVATEKEIRSTDGPFTWGVPFDYDFEFAVLGAPFRKALDKYKDPKIEMKDDKLIVKAGRSRVTLQVFDPVEAPDIRPTAGHSTVIDGFHVRSALEALLPFIAPPDGERQWAASLCLKDGDAYATNNDTIVRYENFPLHSHLDQTLIPVETIKVFLKCKAAPIHFALNANSITFHYSDGSWLRSQLVAGEYSGLAFDLLKERQPCPIEIDDDWRAALKELTLMGQKYVDVYADKLVAKDDASEVETAMSTPGLKGQVRFLADKLLPVIAVAVAWNPNAEPAIHFDANEMFGVIGRM